MKHLNPPEHAADPLRIELVVDRTTLAPTMLHVSDDGSEVEVLMALSAAPGASGTTQSRVSQRSADAGGERRLGLTSSSC